MINLYAVIRFLHVLADIGLFFGNGLQLLGVVLLRRAITVDQARSINHVVERVQGFTIVSVLMTLATGVYMTIAVWGFSTGWIQAALGVIFLIIMPMIAFVVEPRMKRISQLLDDADGALPETVVKRIYDPILSAGTGAILSALISIIFLMTTKPSLFTSVITSAIIILLGLLAGFLAPRKSRR
jgi:hypothetical protein